jgi:hypothetical protein
MNKTLGYGGRPAATLGSRRRLLHGIGVVAAALLGVPTPTLVEATQSACEKRERRCRKRCHRRHAGGLFGCRLLCWRWCGRIDVDVTLPCDQFCPAACDYCYFRLHDQVGFRRVLCGDAGTTSCQKCTTDDDCVGSDYPYCTSGSWTGEEHAVPWDCPTEGPGFCSDVSTCAP